MNKVLLIGNLGQDPEVRYTQNGNPITSVRLATSDKYKDKNTSQLVTKTEWHNIVFFGKLAEIVGEYCRKGSSIFVQGKMQTRKWTDQAGQDKYTTEVIVDSYSGELEMLSSNVQANRENQQSNASLQAYGQQQGSQHQSHTTQQAYGQQQGTQHQSYTTQQAYGQQQGSQHQSHTTQQAYDQQQGTQHQSHKTYTKK